MGQHQMSQLMWGQLRQAKCLSDLIKDLGHRPLADWLACIGVGFGKKEWASILGSIRFDQAGSIKLEVFLQDPLCRIGEHDSSWHVVFRQLMRDFDGMGSLIDVIPSEKGDLLSS